MMKSVHPVPIIDGARRRLGAIVLLIAAGIAGAQGPARPEREDFFPLGGIEALGDVTESKGAPAIVVRRVFEEGIAARAGLAAGDLIVGAGGRKFSKKVKGRELILALEEAIEAAEAAKNHQLVLSVIRGDEKTKKTLDVAFLGRHSRGCPKDCEKCARVRRAALDYLKTNLKDDGTSRIAAGSTNARVVVAAFTALAFAGEPQDAYRESALRAARYVAQTAGTEDRAPSDTGANWNQTNWALSIGAICLAELAARPGGEEFREPLARLVTKLVDNQEMSGGWAHGPGGPNALGYVELEVMSNWALGALGMARRLGIEFDTARMIKGVEYVKACTQGGGVAYSTRPGQLGHGDPGRSAGAFWAFTQLGRTDKVRKEMGKYFLRRMADLPDGHASAVMHVTAGGLAAAIMGASAWKKYWKLYRPHLMAAREIEGRFGASPNAETRQLGSNSDRSNGPPFVTAQYALILQLAQGRYRLLDVAPRRR